MLNKIKEDLFEIKVAIAVLFILNLILAGFNLMSRN